MSDVTHDVTTTRAANHVLINPLWEPAVLTDDDTWFRGVHIVFIYVYDDHRLVCESHVGRTEGTGSIEISWAVGLLSISWMNFARSCESTVWRTVTIIFISVPLFHV